MQPAVRCHTPPGGIARAAQQHFHNLRHDALEIRATLGLPTDRPIVMTGHQPIFYHPGILAKYIAADIESRAINAHAAALVVDSDNVNPGVINVPFHRAADAPSPRPVRLGRPAPPDIAAERRPVLDPCDAGSHDAPRDAGIAARLDRVREQLLAERNAPNAAIQVATTNAALLRPWTTAQLVPVSTYSQLERFRRFTTQLADTPAALAAYNRASAAVPEAGVATLDIDGDDPELPLWRLDDAGRRIRARTSDLRNRDTTRDLRPRAVLTTSFARLYLCDAFIHGTGGGLYDRVTETWLTYAGLDLPTPAPSAVVTADLTLHIDPTIAPTPLAIADAKQHAHRARHNPATLTTDPNLAAQHAELVGAINAAQSRRERRERYRALHTFLADYRSAHRDHLDTLDARARDLERTAQWINAGMSREWPAVLHPSDRLDELARAVRHALADSPART